MPEFRLNPYGAFNFQVDLGDAKGDNPQTVGGFADVSGLGVDVSYSEYRNGNDKVNTVRKIPNTHKLDDVTLKRGVVGSADLFTWLTNVAAGAYEPRVVMIKLFDETHTKPVSQWKLINAQPKKWVGPTFAGKGGGEVAMEELHLVHEGVEYS
jgi:phage tail-like protein